MKDGPSTSVAESDNEPLSIDYADALSRHAAVAIGQEGTFRITVRRRWPTLPPIVSFLLFFVLLPAIASLSRALWNGQRQTAIVSAIFIIIAAIIVSIKRWRRSAVIAATATELTFENCVHDMASAAIEPFVRRNRAAVYRIDCTTAAEAVFVRAHGEEMLELSLPFSAAARERLVDLLNEQLGLEPTRRKSAEDFA